MVIGLALFREFRPTGELCAISIRQRWPGAWFSGSVVAEADFLALLFSIVLAVVAVQYASKRIPRR
jgi:hypothetical protein